MGPGEGFNMNDKDIGMKGDPYYFQVFLFVLVDE